MRPHVHVLARINIQNTFSFENLDDDVNMGNYVNVNEEVLKLV